MSKLLRKCPYCKSYTLKGICSNCGKETSEIKIPKLYKNDKHGKYRRMLKDNVKKRKRT